VSAEGSHKKILMFLIAIIAAIIGGVDHCGSGGRLGVWAAMVAANQVTIFW
jgi:hypothetical protein